MTTTRFDDTSALTRLGQSFKAIVKVCIKSRRVHLPRVDSDRPIIIMGNGPSLNETIDSHITLLESHDLMAVNFMANTPCFRLLKPKYYILADPYFFSNYNDPKISQLVRNINSVDWPMTLFIPASQRNRHPFVASEYLTLCQYNAVGIDGFSGLTHLFYKAALAMPRPRNVLIPALMTSINMGYRNIVIIGADHTWTQTLSVDCNNHVISVQPHFYADDKAEQQRVAGEYIKYPLHHILNSQRIAFMAYHAINRFALSHDVKIINSTPISMIDAFDRAPLDVALNCET